MLGILLFDPQIDSMLKGGKTLITHDIQHAISFFSVGHFFASRFKFNELNEKAFEVTNRVVRLYHYCAL